MINDFDKSSIEMVDWTCAQCGCLQWMPLRFNTQMRENHKTFYCVNGHAQAYNKKTDSETYEEQLASEYSKNAQLESRCKELHEENEKLKKSLLNRIFNL